MPTLDCLICDNLFESARGAAKYCPECSIKQRKAQVERTIRKYKAFSTVKIRQRHDITINCKYCGVEFVTRTSVDGVERLCCSLPCTRAYNRMILHGMSTDDVRKRKRNRKLGGVSGGLHELAGEVEQRVE